MAMTVVFSLPLGIQFDHRVNAHDGDARLHGALQLLDLAHARFQDTIFDRINYSSLCQIESIIPICPLLGNSLLFVIGVSFLDTLRDCMAHTQLSNEFRRVLGCIDGQCFWNNKEGLRKLANG
jgi:hypothetical protein